MQIYRRAHQQKLHFIYHQKATSALLRSFSLTILLMKMIVCCASGCDAELSGAVCASATHLKWALSVVSSAVISGYTVASNTLTFILFTSFGGGKFTYVSSEIVKVS